MSGRPDAAMAHYEQAIGVNPAMPEPWIGGAMALGGVILVNLKK